MEILKSSQYCTATFCLLALKESLMTKLMLNVCRHLHSSTMVFPGGSGGKESAGNAETWVGSLGGEDPLEKGKATHCRILAWRIPWTEEPGRLQSMGLQNWIRLSDFHSYTPSSKKGQNCLLCHPCRAYQVYRRTEDNFQILHKHTQLPVHLLWKMQNTVGNI